MVKILMVATNFPPMEGGISTHSYEVARNIGHDVGHEIAVLSPNCKGVKKFDGNERFKAIRMMLVNTHVMNMLGKALIAYKVYFLIIMMLYITYYSMTLRPKRIYITHWNNAVSALLPTKLFKIPYYLAVHGTEVIRPLESKLRKMLLFLSIRNARKIICLGSYQKISLVKAGVPSNKLCVVSEGVDLKRFKTSIDPSEVIKKHGLKGKKVILTVGRLVKRKGHDMVIKSLPDVLKKVPNAVYVIVGKGPELENLERLVNELDLRKSVIFAGYVPDKKLPKYYSACHVFIMANREVNGDIEGFGIVYLEANAYSKPAVAGKSGGTGDVVKHGVNGLLVDPSNIKEISKVLTHLLTNERLAEKLGMKGRKMVENRYNYSFVAKKIHNIILDAGRG